MSEAIERLCNADELPSNFAKYIIEQAESTQEMNSGKGFCLSTNMDLLSQWRAYGSDGTGFCIGFSKSYLNKYIKHYSVYDPSIMLLPVIYDVRKHDDAILPTYNEIKPLVTNNPRWVRFTSGLLSPDELIEFQQFCSQVYRNTTNSDIHLYRLKHPAFSEESEWRIVSLAKNIDGHAEEYQEANGIINEFIALPLIDLQEQIITKIVLGPKNKNSIPIVSEMLWNSGFQSFDVLTSAIPYK